MNHDRRNLQFSWILILKNVMLFNKIFFTQESSKTMLIFILKYLIPIGMVIFKKRLNFKF